MSSSHSKLLSTGPGIAVSTRDARFYHRVASLLSSRPLWHTAWTRAAGRPSPCHCWPAHELGRALCRSLLLCKVQWRCPLCTELVHLLRLTNISCCISPPPKEPMFAGVTTAVSGLCVMWVVISASGSTAGPLSAGPPFTHPWRRQGSRPEVGISK